MKGKCPAAQPSIKTSIWHAIGCRLLLLEPWGVHTHIMCSTSTACSNQSAQPKQHARMQTKHSMSQHSPVVCTPSCARICTVEQLRSVQCKRQQAGVSCQLENAYTACMYSLEHVGMLTRPSHEAQDAHKCKYLMHSSVRGSQKGGCVRCEQNTKARRDCNRHDSEWRQMAGTSVTRSTPRMRA
jgi:hypothetical protein